MKVEAKKLRKQGMPYTHIAGRFGVAESTIRRWVDPRQAELDRANHRKWKERNRREQAAKDRQRYLGRKTAGDPYPARTCQCEKPWRTREPVCDGSFEDWCLRCSRQLP